MSLDTNENAFDLIKQYRLKNTNKVIRNKCPCLKELISANIDVLVDEETKLNETFS